MFDNLSEVGKGCWEVGFIGCSLAWLKVERPEALMFVGRGTVCLFKVECVGAKGFVAGDYLRKEVRFQRISIWVERCEM